MSQFCFHACAVAFAAVAFGSAALAQPAGERKAAPTASAASPLNPVPACGPQIVSLCEGAKEGRQIVACLRAHADELTTACKLDLERYATASRQAAARSGGQLGGFGGFTGLTPPLPIFSYDGRLSKDFTEHRVTLSSPIAGSASGMTSLSLAGGTTHFKNAVTLTTGQILPQDLHRAEIGTQTSWRLEGRKSLGLRLSAGSTGDQVFQAMRDATFSAAFTYGFPGEAQGDYWLALVYFANNSPLGDYIPIPGLIYIHRTEHFTGVFGFPILSLQYTPSTTWSYSFSIFGTTLMTEAAYGAVTTPQAFVQASFNQQRFILHDRGEDRDRLNLEEKKIGLGYRTSLFNAGFGEIQIGRAFGRRLYIGQKILRAEKGLADLEAQGFVNASFKYVF
jgi:hypothetical protein